MDLSVLHAVKSPDRDYTMKDKLNGITSPLGCRFLEWSGWYNQNISQRLLGHYRLYQLFKAKSQVDSQLSLPVAYIAHYRALHIIKYALSCITAEKVILQSVTRLVGQNNNLPDFSEGYNQWKEAWDNGKGGYWTVDLKDAIEGMDSVMRQNK